MDEMDFYEQDTDLVPYSDARSLDPRTLPAALARLTLLNDDPYLRMQATNLGLVDAFLTQLEAKLLRDLVQEDGTPIGTAFVLAQSQMWIFAAYELLRTWKQRVKDTEKLIKAGKIAERIADLEKDLGYRHTARLMRAEQLRQVSALPDALECLDADLRRIHVTFGLMNVLRMALAKHENQGVRDSVANAPGYGRINRWCGAIDFELSKDWGIIGTINHREIADGLRFMWDHEPQSWDALKGFDMAMRGPPEQPNF